MKPDVQTGLSDGIDLSGLGLRPITRWVPRTRDEDFIRRYREQRAVIAAAAHESDEMFWERAQTHEGWT